jgi:hypothetical protein
VGERQHTGRNNTHNNKKTIHNHKIHKNRNKKTKKTNITENIVKRKLNNEGKKQREATNNEIN